MSTFDWIVCYFSYGIIYLSILSVFVCHFERWEVVDNAHAAMHEAVAHDHEMSHDHESHAHNH